MHCFFSRRALTKLDRRVHADAQDEPCGSSTSLPSVAAIVPPPPISDAGHRALEAAEDAADDRADAGAHADAAGLALDAFALDRLR